MECKCLSLKIIKLPEIHSTFNEKVALVQEIPWAGADGLNDFKSSLVFVLFFFALLPLILGFPQFSLVSTANTPPLKIADR